MIFSLFNLYRQVKHGTKDPTGFAAEEVHGLFLETLLLPGIILVIVTILLAILGFTSWIIHPTLVARIFFWLFFFGTLIYGLITFVLATFLKRVLTKGKTYVDEKMRKR